MIPYFQEKPLCSVAQEIRYTLFFLFYLKNYLMSMFTEFVWYFVIAIVT